MKRLFIFLVLSSIFCLFFLLPLTSAQLTGNLTEFWNVDETSGNALGVLGIINMTLKNPDGSITQGVTGLIDEAIDHSGGSANDFFTNATVVENVLNMKAGTVCTWIKPGSFSGTDGLLAYQNVETSTKSDFVLYTNAGKVGVKVLTNNLNDWIFETTNSITPSMVAGNWQHLCVVHNSTTPTLYWNGTEVATTYSVSTNTSKWFKDISLDAVKHGWFFFGEHRGGNFSAPDLTMDLIGVWNTNLSTNQLGVLYNSGLGQTYPFAGVMSVTLNTPENNDVYTTGTIPFNATIDSSLASGFTLENATIYIWDSDDTIVYQNYTNLTGTVNDSYFPVTNLSFGDYTWNVFGVSSNSTGSLLTTFAPSNFSFEVQTFQVDAESYDTLVYETQNASFEINITINANQSFFSASLVYNGTPYLYDYATDLGGGSYSIHKSIDIPLVASNNTKNFHWQLTFGDGTFVIQNTTSNSQTVANTNLSTTGIAPYSINFTILDESTLTPVYADFGGTFNWYIGGGTITENASFDLSTAATSFPFYFDPYNYNFTTNIGLEITNNSDYHQRLFDFNKVLLGHLGTNQSLLLMPSTNGTNIIIEVKDEGLSPLDGVYVVVERYYPESNQFYVVESRFTDDFGQFSSRLIENTVKYRFSFYDPSDNSLLKREENIFVSCRTVICVLPFVISDTTNNFDRYNEIDGFNYTLDFIEVGDAGYFSATWNDNTGDVPIMRLEITKRLFNGTSVVYNQSTSGKVGSFSYTVGSDRATYTANIYRKVGGDESRLGSLSKKIGDLSATFGLEGMFWSFILLMTLILFGVWSPPVGVALYLVGVFFLGITDIVFINPAIIFGQLVIGGLFIWAFRR